MNYWGYSTVGFFAPKAGYAATGRFGMQVDEFKTLVKELHRNGIEVILDVVFNHTAEGNERGPTISFRGIDNKTYYMLTPEGYYFNFSGTGNTLNCNNPDRAQHGARLPALLGGRIPHRRLPLRSGRDSGPRSARRSAARTRRCSKRSPSIRFSAKCKLIAEAWDAGGLYQVGIVPGVRALGGMERPVPRQRSASFSRATRVRSASMAQRVQGSPDLYVDGRGAGGLDQFHHLPRRLHACATSSRTTRSTTRPTAKTTVTAPTTTRAGTAAGKATPTIRRSTRSAAAR